MEFLDVGNGVCAVQELTSVQEPTDSLDHGKETQAVHTTAAAESLTDGEPSCRYQGRGTGGKADCDLLGGAGWLPSRPAT